MNLREGAGGVQVKPVSETECVQNASTARCCLMAKKWPGGGHTLTGHSSGGRRGEKVLTRREEDQ